MDVYQSTTLSYGMDRCESHEDRCESHEERHDPSVTTTWGYRDYEITTVYHCFGLVESREAYLLRRWRETGSFLFRLAGIKRLLFDKWMYPTDSIPPKSRRASRIHRAFLRMAPAVWRCRNFYKVTRGKPRVRREMSRHAGGKSLQCLFA